MSKTLKISVSSPDLDNKQIGVADITGNYDVNDNPNGWGTPNEDPEEYKILVITETITDDDYAYSRSSIANPKSTIKVPLDIDSIYGFLLIALPYQTEAAASNDTYFVNTSDDLIYFKTGGSATLLEGDLDVSKVPANDKAFELVAVTEFTQQEIDQSRSMLKKSGDPARLSIKQILINAAKNDLSKSPLEAQRTITTLLNI